jgi:hypothetical protein
VITVPELATEALGSFLAKQITRRFGSTHAASTELIPSAARLALECVGNSDALYHNVEHTMLVTLAGYDIMRGRALLIPTDASDFAHLILACLFHDIGYVRGILEGDGPDGYVIDAKGGKTKLRKSVFEGHGECETYWCERSNDQSASRCHRQPSRAFRVIQHCPKTRTRAD